VRAKPPLPAHKGLFGKPTVINNLISLATVPAILADGAEHYAALGVGRSRGTMPIQLAGNSKYGGLFEAAFGLTLGEIVEDIGGGTRSGGLGPVWHSVDDTLEYIDRGALTRDARIYLGVLWQLLTRPLLPLDQRRPVAEIRARLEEYSAPAAGRFNLAPLVAIITRRKRPSSSDTAS